MNIKVIDKDDIYQRGVDEIMKIQREQMTGWHAVLNDKAYADLAKWVEKKNAIHTRDKLPAMSITRGVDLGRFVSMLQLYMIGVNDKHPSELM